MISTDFLAGVLVSALTAILISRIHVVWRVSKTVAHALWVGLKFSRRSKKADQVVLGPEENMKVLLPGTKRKQSDSLGRPEKKTFEFRKRLWHEPPELDYSGFESYDVIQRQFKEMGGKDFEWKTNWLDLTAELHLLHEYRTWSETQLRDKEIPQEEREFYDGLCGSVLIDRAENLDELERGNARFGKTRWEIEALFRIVYDMRQNWKLRVGRA